MATKEIQMALCREGICIIEVLKTNANCRSKSGLKGYHLVILQDLKVISGTRNKFTLREIIIHVSTCNWSSKC